MNLRCRAADDLTLVEAMAGFAPLLGERGGAALLYTARCCRMVRLDGGGSIGQPPGLDPIDLATVFEARAFVHVRDPDAGPLAEMRWLHCRQGKGRAAWTGTFGAPALTVGAALPDRPCTGTIDQTYLLWGEAEAEAPAAGWTTLSAAQIGRIVVPVEGVAPNGRLLLCAREFIGPDIGAPPGLDFGATVVVDELLYGWKHA